MCYSNLRAVGLGVIGILLLSGCCKDKTDSSDSPPLPDFKPAETVKVLSPEEPGLQGNAAPTGQAAVDPAPASTDAYQANGFPQVMPSTRTPAPKAAEWNRAPVITTKKFPDGCHIKFVREWMKINCSLDTDTATPIRIDNITGFGREGSDYFKFEKPGKVLDIVVRTKDGKGGSALYVTSERTYRVGYNWPYRAPFPSTIFE